MPHTFFAGNLGGSRSRAGFTAATFGAAREETLEDTVLWTSRTYAAILRDAVALDPRATLPASGKLFALCKVMERMLSVIQRALPPLEADDGDGGDEGLDELKGLQRAIKDREEALKRAKKDQQEGEARSERQGNTSKGKGKDTTAAARDNAEATFPWETALELLMHIAILKADTPPDIDDIPQLFQRLENLQQVLTHKDFKENQKSCGLPVVLFVCRHSAPPPRKPPTMTLTDALRPRGDIADKFKGKDNTLEAGAGADVVTKQAPEEKADSDEHTYIVTTTAERWALVPLKNWAMENGTQRRLRLLERYEGASVFGATIVSDREAFSKAFLGAFLSRGSTAPPPPSGRPLAVTAAEAVLRWLIHQGPGRVQEHLIIPPHRGGGASDGYDYDEEGEEEMAAAFSVVDEPGQLPYKARCYLCRATFCHSMPEGAWLAEDLGNEPEKMAPVPGSPTSCAEVVARVLCNEAARVRRAARREGGV